MFVRPEGGGSFTWFSGAACSTFRLASVDESTKVPLVLATGELGRFSHVDPPSAFLKTHIWFTCGSVDAVRVTFTDAALENAPVPTESGVQLDRWPLVFF